MGEGLFQPGHVLVILGLALIIFGPGKLSEAGAALGRSVREFRSAVRGVEGAPPTGAVDHCPACRALVSAASAYCPNCGASLALQRVASTNGSSGGPASPGTDEANAH